MTGLDYLISQGHADTRMPGHAPFAAAKRQAVYATLKALRDGTSPKDPKWPARHPKMTSRAIASADVRGECK